MKQVRDSIEAGFKRFGYFVIKYRWGVLLFIFLITVGFISQLRNIKFDTSNEGFFRKNDPAMVNYTNFREQFGRDEMLIVMIQPKEIFDLSFLKKLKKLHEELEEKIPQVLEVNSLINARFTRGKEGALIVKDLLEEFPKSDKEMED